MNATKKPARCTVIEHGKRCPNSVVGWGWCGKHYARWLRNGDPLWVRPPQPARCTVVEHGKRCENPARARGWCGKHYMRWRKYGDSSYAVRSWTRSPSDCKVKGCQELARVLGWCSYHYEILRKGPECSSPGCYRRVKAWCLCSMCYQRWQRTGDPSVVKPRRARVPVGTTWKSHLGYLEEKAPAHPLASKKGIVAQHRKALYDKIGPGEHPCHVCGALLQWGSTLCVDHLDWRRDNNDPRNLAPVCRPCNSKRNKEYEQGDDRFCQGCGAKRSPHQHHSLLPVPWSTHSDGLAHVTFVGSPIPPRCMDGADLLDPSTVPAMVQDERGMWRVDSRLAQREAARLSRAGLPQAG